MESVFIDTSVFEANNFTRGEKIRQLMTLSADGHIRILLPEITYREIVTHIERYVRDGVKEYDRMRRKTRIFKNIEDMVKRLDDLNPDKLVLDAISKFDQMIADGKVMRLPYPKLDTKDVFDSYFEGTSPFGTGTKKSEFPDAFVLKTIEIWCEENDTTCTIYTMDKDFSDYNHPRLHYVKSYTDDLSTRLRDIENLELLDDWFEIARGEIETELFNWAESQLFNENTYLDLANWLDVHSIEQENITVGLDNYEVSSIEGDSVVIEVFAHVSYEMKVEYDDENSLMWDSEDKVATYLDTTVETVDDYLETTLVISISKEELAEMFIHFDLIRINDNQDISIKRDWY